MNKSINDTLDDILNYYINYTLSLGTEEANKYTPQFFIDFKVNLNINHQGNLYEQFEAQLIADKLITKDIHGIVVTTIKGMLFEGYAKQNENEVLREAHIREQADRMVDLSNKLNYWTKRAAVGAIGLILTELLTHWKDLKDLFCVC